MTLLLGMSQMWIFLFSSSESERVVSVWSLDTSTTSTLRVNANVTDMSVHTDEEEISIGVLTTEGVMAVLTCSQTSDKSGLVSQPLKTVKVKTEQGVTRTVTAVGMVKDKVSQPLKTVKVKTEQG